MMKSGNRKSVTQDLIDGKQHKLMEQLFIQAALGDPDARSFIEKDLEQFAEAGCGN
jgi:hypothetical protein